MCDFAQRKLARVRLPTQGILLMSLGSFGYRSGPDLLCHRFGGDGVVETENADLKFRLALAHKPKKAWVSIALKCLPSLLLLVLQALFHHRAGL